MRLLELTKGKFAQVDDEDYYWLCQFNWSAIQLGNTWYARRNKKKSKLRNTLNYEIYLHRVIMRESSILVIDHIDHDGLNCQKVNLRACTSAENKRYVTSNKDSTSKYLGVTYCKERNNWMAALKHNGIKYLNVRFKNEDDAAIAYDIVAKIHHKEFANLNFPEKIHTETLEELISRTRIPYIVTEEHKDACRKGLKKVDWAELRKDKYKKVVNIITGEIYESAKKAMEISGIPKSTFFHKLQGSRINNTNYKYI